MLITNDILIFIFNRWQPKYGPGVHAVFGDPLAVSGSSTDQADRGVLDTSRDSEDTVLDEGIQSCQVLTNEFARQNAIGIGKSGSFREHSFLMEIRRMDVSYAKCIFCSKEFEIDINTMNNLFLSSYTHMSCALYDEKIHLLHDIDAVQRIQDTNIQLRKILMSANMIKSAYHQNWDPAMISGCIKAQKKCRLLDLPHMK